MNAMPSDADVSNLNQKPDGFPMDLPPVEPPSAGFIVQLFVIPAIIVVVVVGVWLAFGKLAGGERSAMSYVETIKSPSANWRAAYELSSLIKNDATLSRDGKLLGELAALLDQDLNLKTDAQLLQWLASSLGTFQTLDAIDSKNAKVDVLAVLCKAFDDTRTPEVRIAAGVSIAQHAARMEGKLDDPRVVKALLTAQTAPSVEIRKIAAYALGFMGGADSKAALRELATNDDRDTRYNAALALGRRDDIAALGAFRDMLSDKSLETLYQDTPAGERTSKIEAIELEALNSLGLAAGKGQMNLLKALKSEVVSLTKSGLVTVRNRAGEALKFLPMDQ